MFFIFIWRLLETFVVFNYEFIDAACYWLELFVSSNTNSKTYIRYDYRLYQMIMGGKINMIVTIKIKHIMPNPPDWNQWCAEIRIQNVPIFHLQYFPVYLFILYMVFMVNVFFFMFSYCDFQHIRASIMCSKTCTSNHLLNCILNFNRAYTRVHVYFPAIILLVFHAL